MGFSSPLTLQPHHPETHVVLKLPLATQVTYVEHLVLGTISYNVPSSILLCGPWIVNKIIWKSHSHAATM